MIRMIRLSLLATALLASAAIPPARAAAPPSDLCSLLSAGEISKALGNAYDAPKKSIAPRPFPGTNEGTDCHYPAKSGGGELWLRAYVDPSPAAATELFAKLRFFYSPPKPVAGLADEAYYDPRHGLHVRKGNVRYFLQLDTSNFTAANEKQLNDLAAMVAGKL